MAFVERMPSAKTESDAERFAASWWTLEGGERMEGEGGTGLADAGAAAVFLASISGCSHPAVDVTVRGAAGAAAAVTTDPAARQGGVGCRVEFPEAVDIAPAPRT